MKETTELQTGVEEIRFDAADAAGAVNAAGTVSAAGAVTAESESAVQEEQEERDPLAPPARKTTLKERWKGARKLDTIVIASILAVIIATVGTTIGSPLMMASQWFGNTDAALYTIFQYLAFLGVWLVCILALVIPKRNRPILQVLKPGWGGNTPKYILLGLVIGFGMNATVVLVASLVGSITLTFDSFNVIGVVVCFFAVLVQSSAEELVDRCYLYRKLARNYHSPLVPIITTAVVFSAMHVGNFFLTGNFLLPSLDILASGVMFALMIYYWKSFWAAALCHTAWNFTQNIIFGLPNSGNVTPLHIFTTATEPTASFAYDPAFGVEGCLLAVVIQIAVCIVIAVVGEKKRRAQMAEDAKSLPLEGAAQSK